MGAIRISSENADPNPAGVYIPVGWHDGQLYYQNTDNLRWYLVFYDYDVPEWSLQQSTPLTSPGDCWSSPNGWVSIAGETATPGPITGKYVARGIVRGDITIKPL